MSQHPTDAELLTALRAGLENRPVPSPELAAFLANPSSSPVAPMVPVVGGAGGTGRRHVSAASRWVMAVAAVLVLLAGAGASHVLPGPVQDAFDTVVRVVLPDRGREPRVPAPIPEPSRGPVPSNQLPDQDSIPDDRPARSDGTGSVPRGGRGEPDDGAEDGAEDVRDREEDLAEQQQERREDQRDRREEQRDRAADAAEEEKDEAADAAEDAQDEAEDEAEDARDREEDRDEERKEREQERRD